VSSPTFSPDGKWMWTGSEWIPAPPAETPVEKKIDTSFVDEILGVEVRDSVVMGDIHTIINDTDSISSAVQSASKCGLCGSVGATQISCSSCNQLAYCSVCTEEVYSNRAKLLTSYTREESIFSSNKSYFNQRLCDLCFTASISDFQKCDGCKQLDDDIKTCFKCGEKRCGRDSDNCRLHSISCGEYDLDKRKQLSLHRIEDTIYLCGHDKHTSSIFNPSKHIEWTMDGYPEKKVWSWLDAEFDEKMKDSNPPKTYLEERGTKAWTFECPKGHMNMLIDYIDSGLESNIEWKNPMKCEKIFCRKKIDLKSVNMKKAWPFE
jgi:hypothetical protein